MGTQGEGARTGHARVAASILDADPVNLAREIRRGERGGTDRFHLDVMDGHFVPNISFGPATVAAVRPLTELPLDVHLMVSHPSRYVDTFLDAGADSLTFHVEIEEPKEPTLAAIRRAGRAAGLAVSPGTAIEAVEPFAALLDIVMVMGVEPGFGGQGFIQACGAKIPRARALLAARPLGEVHVDGGVNRDNAELLGALGVDVLVAGSALYRRGRDLGREVRLLRTLADEGWTVAHGVPRAPRDRWVSLITVPPDRAEPARERLAAAGVPAIVVSAEDGAGLREILVPAPAAGYVRAHLPDLFDGTATAGVEAALGTGDRGRR